MRGGTVLIPVLLVIVAGTWLICWRGVPRR